MRLWIQLGPAAYVPYHGHPADALAFAAELARRDALRVVVAAGKASDSALRVLGVFGADGQPYPGEAA